METKKEKRELKALLIIGAVAGAIMMLCGAYYTIHGGLTGMIVGCCGAIATAVCLQGLDPMKEEE